MAEIIRLIKGGQETDVVPKPQGLHSQKPTLDSKHVGEIWASAQQTECLQHPELGKISPNQFRAMMRGKPCACCGTTMVFGDCFKVKDKEEAKKRGYMIGGRDDDGPIYMNPRYTTLDHILPKSHYPHLVLEFRNLQVICLRCNSNKKTSYTYDIKFRLDKLDREFENLKKDDI